MAKDIRDPNMKRIATPELAQAFIDGEVRPYLRQRCAIYLTSSLQQKIGDPKDPQCNPFIAAIYHLLHYTFRAIFYQILYD